MHSFHDLSLTFKQRFDTRHFPVSPESLYDPAQYMLQLGGKHVRPVLCLMANELVNTISDDAYHVANAIELFHNFTLIHDDIMDKAPLRRGMMTVHEKYGDSTALLAGDVMLVAAYESLNRIKSQYLQKVLSLFNVTARQVCEGQQLDMDFSKKRGNDNAVSFDQYVNMIELKTSVLLAASLKMGAIISGAGEGNQQNLFEFGKHLGLAFQVQDDYLDVFGDPGKFGKQQGGDIVANKKTFLWLHVIDVANKEQLLELESSASKQPKEHVELVTRIYKECNVDAWAMELKEKYYQQAMHYLEDVAITSSRKIHLADLAKHLLNRDT